MTFVDKYRYKFSTKKKKKCSSEKIDNSFKIVSLFFFYKEDVSVPV